MNLDGLDSSLRIPIVPNSFPIFLRTVLSIQPTIGIVATLIFRNFLFSFLASIIIIIIIYLFIYFAASFSVSYNP